MWCHERCGGGASAGRAVRARTTAKMSGVDRLAHERVVVALHGLDQRRGDAADPRDRRRLRRRARDA